MQRLATLLCVILVLLLGVGWDASAGDKKKKDGGQPPKIERSPEHQILASWAGTFDAKVSFYFPDPTKPTQSSGVMTRTMILGGNFLQESFQGDFLGAPFQGMGIVGFDERKMKFTVAWVDSASTDMLLMEGTFDAKTKTLTMLGTVYEPNLKKKMKARDVLRIVSPDVHVFEMYRQPEGEAKEFKVMDITYTRRKDKK